MLSNTPAEEWHPDWSPDGTRLLFQCASADGGPNVCVVNADGSGYAPITHWSVGNAGAQRPVWSPDGRQLAFEYAHDSVAIVGAAGTSASGGSPRIVAAKGSWNLSWSPDGQKLVLAPPGEGLWLVEVDGSGMTQIAQDGSQPSWQPMR